MAFDSVCIILLDYIDDRSIFATNLVSFVSFGKTHKLHNAIYRWLAGVAGQAHVALDAVTKEERAVHIGHRGNGERKEVEKQRQSFGGGYGAELRPTVGGLTERAVVHRGVTTQEEKLL